MSVITDLASDVRSRGVKNVAASVADEAVTRFTAGLSWNDVRSLLRGDPPGKPNPRLKLHSEAFWLHIIPSYYHESVTKIGHTFRLGMLSTYFFIVEIITGIFLMIFYAPTPQRAYTDMLNILSNVPYGQFMRDVHRLTAEAMVVVVTLHMLRTYLTGSYKKPRQFTWFTGCILLLVTLFLSFSGYLLPWDQLSLWAVTIGTSMAEAAPPAVVGENVNLILRGAPDIGAGGLLRFYLLHVFFLPLILITFFFVHYYKVVHYGISLPANEEEVGQDTATRIPADRRRYYLPDVAMDQLWQMLGVTALLFLSCATFYHAALENHSDPGHTPLHTTAPWYFLWLQGMLKLGDKTLMGIILPTVIFGVLFLIPYIDFNPSRRAKDRRLALWGVTLFSLFLVVLTFMGTPRWGVDAPAAVELIQEFVPEEGTGIVRSMGYNNLPLGTYDIAMQGDTPHTSSPEFDAFLKDLQKRIGAYNPLATGGAHTQVSVQEWQDGLKRIKMTVMWKDANGQDQTQFKSFYVHKDQEFE